LPVAADEYSCPPLRQAELSSSTSTWAVTGSTGADAMVGIANAAGIFFGQPFGDGLDHDRKRARLSKWLLASVFESALQLPVPWPCARTSLAWLIDCGVQPDMARHHRMLAPVDPETRMVPSLRHRRSRPAFPSLNRAPATGFSLHEMAQPRGMKRHLAPLEPQ